MKAAVDLESVGREWARRRLLRFIQSTFPKYQAGWFHREVCESLDQFLQDQVA